MEHRAAAGRPDTAGYLEHPDPIDRRGGNALVDVTWNFLTPTRTAPRVRPFNNGFHGMHHEKPGLHWSLLPAAHATTLRPHLHPALDHQSLAIWAWRYLVWPGRRLDYLGRPMTFPETDHDVSWIPASGDGDAVHIGAAGS